MPNYKAIILIQIILFVHIHCELGSYLSLLNKDKYIVSSHNLTLANIDYLSFKDPFNISGRICVRESLMLNCFERDFELNKKWV